MKKNNDTYFISSVDNALRILIKLSEANDLSIRELSKELDISRSTLYRILRTLENKKFVKQDDKTEKYSLGLTLFKLGMSTKEDFDIRNISIPYMKNLRDLTGETVQLSILDDNEIVLLENIEGVGELRIFSSAGLRFPITYGNFGKVFLSYMDEETIREKVMNYPLNKYTRNSITDIEEYIKQLKDVKKSGYSFGINDPIDGGFSVAIPILNNKNKVIASIALSGPNTEKNQKNITNYINLLRNASIEISEMFGYKKNRQ